MRIPCGSWSPNVRAARFFFGLRAPGYALARARVFSLQGVAVLALNDLVCGLREWFPMLRLNSRTTARLNSYRKSPQHVHQWLPPPLANRARPRLVRMGVGVAPRQQTRLRHCAAFSEQTVLGVHHRWVSRPSWPPSRPLRPAHRLAPRPARPFASRLVAWQPDRPLRPRCPPIRRRVLPPPPPRPLR